ncbi:MAG: hypothetical protein AABX96_05070 [Nanoarchaeota archaeon]
MAKLEALAEQEAERLQAEGKLLAEELPSTKTRWFNMLPLLRLIAPSADTRYEWEIRRLAKKHKANAIYESQAINELLIGSEFPYTLKFYCK